LLKLTLEPASSAANFAITVFSSCSGIENAFAHPARVAWSWLARATACGNRQTDPGLRPTFSFARPIVIESKFLSFVRYLAWRLGLMPVVQ
jgi:hypothetical protein